MAYAAGSSYGAIYKVEAVYGTAPGTDPHFQTARVLGGGPNLSKDYYESAELRTDRMISDFRQGNEKVGGDIPFELSYGTQNDMIEAFLGGTYAAGFVISGVSVVIVKAAHTWTRAAGSWIDSGVMVGDRITTTLFDDGDNNGVGTVTAVTDLVLTTSGITMANSAGDIGTFTAAKYTVKNGVTDRSFTWERQFTDITQYLLYTGCRVDTFSLSVKAGGMVTGSYSFIGKSLTASGATIDAAPIAATTTSPFDSYTGTIHENGTAIAYITGIDINGVKNMRGLPVLMDDKIVDAKAGRTKINGTVTAYFTDLTLLNKFIGETETSISIMLTDPAGNMNRFFFPRVKYTGGDLPVSGEGEVTLSLPFASVYDSTFAATMIHEYQVAV